MTINGSTAATTQTRPQHLPGTQNYKLPAPGHRPGGPGHLSPVIRRDDNIISGQTRRDQKTAALTNFIIHSTPILYKERIKGLWYSPILLQISDIYFFSVSKSNNMKGNAAETFIKPTTHQKIECKSNCLSRKKWKFFSRQNSILSILALLKRCFKNQFQH